MATTTAGRVDLDAAAECYKRSGEKVDKWKRIINRCGGLACAGCGLLKMNIKQEEEKMNTYNNQYSTLGNLASNPEKYVVMTNTGNFKGSWAKEEHALKYIKNQIKNDTTTRYLILQAIKEVGTKTPEIEIEEIK